MKLYINNNLLNNAEWQYQSKQNGIITLNSNNTLTEIINQFSNSFTLTIEFTEEKIENFYECVLVGIQKESTQYILTINFSLFERDILNEIETTISDTENAILELATLYNTLMSGLNIANARIENDNDFAVSKIQELNSLIHSLNISYKQMETECDSLTEQVQQLSEQLQEKDTLLMHLEETVSNLNERVNQLENPNGGDYND